MIWFARSVKTLTLVCVLFITACSDGKSDSRVSSAGEQKLVIAQDNSSLGKVGEQMKNKTDLVLRSARGSGRWFPGDGKQLATMVGDFIKKAEVPDIKGRIVGAIAPHAGYIYSGKVAGYTFKAIQANAVGEKGLETVVVLGFNHRRGFRGVALMDGDVFVTPMGEIPIDVESTRFLASISKRIIADYSFFGDEHSAENEIPFVQAAVPGVKIVVGLFGDHDGETMNELVSALSELSKKKKILVIASTDMLHHADYELVTKTDKATLEKLASMDTDTLIKKWNMDNQIFCGMMPVLTVMRFAGMQGCKKATILYYRNSGDDFPESRGNWVVGYGAAVFVVQE
ncbi:MAG: AmmeMemoRadiSam system protein B [Kiritimatiellae bacterium]|nr:AmmeMemoRadiSam system protein B [Kiritimatiellia bacterium]MDD5520013.1 AmmeMemoRadiSam system protein B [Kiritimatiellia bacterium]